MSTNQELRKPTFVKVKDLEKVRSGYNVYVKVITADIKDIETRDGKKIRMVDAVVGDQTGISKAFFKGENATHIEKGSVIAIRNGMKKFIKNFISLELDIFGRVTKEDVEINVNESYNISEQQHKLPEKRQGGRGNFSEGRRDNRGQGRFNNNRPQRRFDDRPQRRYDDKPRRIEGGQGETRNERPARERRQDRPVREDRQNRPTREGRNDRPAREDRQYRPTREGRNDRPVRQDRGTGDRRDRQYGNQPQRRDNRENRDNRDNRTYDRDFDRRRDNGERPQRRQQPRYEPRREEFRERAPVQWSKIDQISPGDQKLNLIVKVLSEELVKGRNKDMVRCTVGDQSGLVKAFLNDSSALRVGKSVALFDCEARVIKEHIEIQCRGRIEAARKDVDKVNEKWNLSDKSWVPVD